MFDRVLNTSVYLRKLRETRLAFEVIFSIVLNILLFSHTFCVQLLLKLLENETDL